METGLLTEDQNNKTKHWVVNGKYNYHTFQWNHPVGLTVRGGKLEVLKEKHVCHELQPVWH